MVLNFNVSQIASMLVLEVFNHCALITFATPIFYDSQLLPIPVFFVLELDYGLNSCWDFRLWP